MEFSIRKRIQKVFVERILQWQIQDFPLGGGADLRHGCFLAKTYAKTKELDPVGGGARAGSAPPPDLPVICIKY